jgi:16S rRNA (uracil1498-N3)-methyltransferase
MSIPHFFIEERMDGTVGEAVSLTVPKQVNDHMCTLRLKAHERVVLVDTPGHGWELELTAAPQRKIPQLDGVLIAESTGVERAALTLVQGISASDRMDQTIRQTTELGISCIMPLESARSAIRLDASTRVAKRERWQRIARGAAEQSGQLVMPVIEQPRPLKATLTALESYDALLFFWEEPQGHLLREVLQTLDPQKGGKKSTTPSGNRYASTDASANTSTDATFARQNTGEPQETANMPLPQVAIFIGPEGGFSADEAALIKAAGAKTITLGATILRTETAAVVACALILYHLRAFDAKPLQTPRAPDANLTSALLAKNKEEAWDGG